MPDKIVNHFVLADGSTAKYDVGSLAGVTANTEQTDVQEVLAFPNTGKSLNSAGALVDNPPFNTSDYIDLTDVVGVYRTGTTVRFTLWMYCFYDANKNFISLEPDGTDYEIVEYNGQQVTWLTLNPNAKYMRVVSNPSRPFTYYVVTSVDEIASLEMPQLIVDGENLYDGSVNGTQAKGVVDEITYDTSINLLNPENFIANGYYYDFSDGVTKINNANFKMTTDKIEVNQDEIFVRQTYSTTSTNNFLVYCYSNDNYLGYVVEAFAVLGASFTMVLHTGTTHIRIFSNAGASISGDQICVTLSEVDEFVEYSIIKKVKPDALPDTYTYLPLYGKTIANFGDSIFGNKRPPNDVSTSLAKVTGATVYNLGFGGCRMAKHSPNWDAFSMYQLADAIATGDFSVQNAVDVDNVSGMPAYFKETRTLLESIDFSKVDIITIAYGTNDFTASIPLDNENNPTDINTFAGALRYSLEKIMSAYPQLHVFVCTPTYRFWIDTNDDNAFLYDSDTHEINGVLLTAFVEKAQTTSKEYHVKSINNYDDLGINKWNRSEWFPENDGTHHNQKGGMLIAQHMAVEMF